MTSSIIILAPVAIAVNCFESFVLRLDGITVLTAVGANFFTLPELDLNFDRLRMYSLGELAGASDFTIRITTGTSSTRTNIGIPIKAYIFIQMLLTSIKGYLTAELEQISYFGSKTRPNSSASTIVIISSITFQPTER